MKKYSDVVRALKKFAKPEKAKILQRFFKTGKGDYGEGDRFLGIVVPDQRRIARSFSDLPQKETLRLLRSPFHENRLTALFILCHQFRRGTPKHQERIYRLYLRNTRWINNWDLVDTTAPHIVGAYLVNRPKGILRTLARSKNLWERRIAILSTQAFIRRGDFDETLRIAAMLLRDAHDLIHKAVGWMLREVGDRDFPIEEAFVRLHLDAMPRTMLRYAVEKWPKKAKNQLTKSSIRVK